MDSYDQDVYDDTLNSDSLYIHRYDDIGRGDREALSLAPTTDFHEAGYSYDHDHTINPEIVYGGGYHQHQREEQLVGQEALDGQDRANILHEENLRSFQVEMFGEEHKRERQHISEEEATWRNYAQENNASVVERGHTSLAEVWQMQEERRNLEASERELQTQGLLLPSSSQEQQQDYRHSNLPHGAVSLLQDQESALQLDGLSGPSARPQLSGIERPHRYFSQPPYPENIINKTPWVPMLTAQSAGTREPQGALASAYPFWSYASKAAEDGSHINNYIPPDYDVPPTQFNADLDAALRASSSHHPTYPSFGADLQPHHWPDDQELSENPSLFPEISHRTAICYWDEHEPSPKDTRGETNQIETFSLPRLPHHSTPALSEVSTTPSAFNKVMSCPVENCSVKFTGVDRRRKRIHHLRRFHEDHRYPCGMHGCDKIFYLKDAYLSHMKRHTHSRPHMSHSTIESLENNSLKMAKSREKAVAVVVDAPQALASFNNKSELVQPGTLTHDHEKAGIQASKISYLRNKGLTTGLQAMTGDITNTISSEFHSKTDLSEQGRVPDTIASDRGNKGNESTTPELERAVTADLKELVAPGILQAEVVESNNVLAEAELVLDQTNIDRGILSKNQQHRPMPEIWMRPKDTNHNRPDIAHAVSQEALKSGSETESSDEEMQNVANSDGAAPTTSNGIADLEARDWVLSIHQVFEEVSRGEVRYNEDNLSSAGSTYAASVFSIESLATQATDLSQASGYSKMQIASATKTLVNILQDDDLLVPLYQHAIDSAAIGPDRLQRNLCKLFKRYARNLGEEYVERLEYLASRLVAILAQYLAKSIVDKYRPIQALPSEDMQEPQGSSEDDSDDEFGGSSVEDKDFDDLHMFRQFLVGGNAFATLRTEILAFTVPKTSRSANPCSTTLVRQTKKRVLPLLKTWRVWRDDLFQTIDTLLLRKEASLAVKMAAQLIPDALMLMTDKFCIATGLLEPPISPGLTRLRWRCGCGDRLYSDVAELQPNGIKNLTELMEASAGVKVTAIPYNQFASNQQYTGSRHFRWFGSRSSSVLTPSTQGSQSTLTPTQHSTSCQPTKTAATTQSNATQGSLLHLMACAHDKGADKILLQDRIQDVATDRALIQFLRCQYRRHRSGLRSLLSLKRVQGIHFVRFHLPLGDSVIIIPHETTCTRGVASTTACECLPPLTRVSPPGASEYLCRPVPPKTFPPIPPEYLLSFFTCAKEPHVASKWMIEQFPKRSWGELFGAAEQPAEGWGIYYKEGWDPKIIARVVLGLLMASLVFGAVWTSVRGDVQGGFGVAAWIVGVGGAGLGVLVTSVDGL